MKVFVRDCWNRDATSDEFFEELKQQSFNETDLLDYLVDLLCSLPNYPTQLIDYFCKVLKEFPYLFAKCLDEENPNHVKLVDFIDIKSVIINVSHWKVGDFEAANFALKILFLVFKMSNQKIYIFFNFIGMEVMFNIYLSSSRILLPDLFKKARDRFDEMLTLKNIQISFFSKSMNNFFVQAFLKDAIDISNFKYHKPFSKIVYESNYVINHNVLFQVSPSNYFIEHCAYHLMLEFITNPSPLKGYILSSYLQHIYKSSEIGEEEYYYETSEEHKQEIWSRITRSCFHNKVLKQETMMAACFNPPLGASAKEGIDKFLYCPQNFGISNIFLASFTYPSISLGIPDLFIKNMTLKRQQNAFSLCNQALQYTKEFVHIMKESKKMKQFLKKTVTFMEKIQDNKIFEPVWFVFLSCIKVFWMTGEENLRNFVTSFIDEQSKKLKDFLNKFLYSPHINRETLNKPKPKIDINTINPMSSSSDDISSSIIIQANNYASQHPSTFVQSNTQINRFTQPKPIEFLKINDFPFNKCIRFYDYIKHDTINESMFLIGNLKFLYPIAITWGINTLSKDALKFSSVQSPENYLCETILSEMFIYLKPCMSQNRIPDFDLQVNFCADLEQIEYEMGNMVKKIDLDIDVISQEVFELGYVVGRSWIKVHGMKNYFKVLMSSLNNDSTVRQLFYSIEASKMLSMLLYGIIAQNRRQCFEILDVVFDMIKDETLTINFNSLIELLCAIFISLPPTDLEWIDHVTKFIIQIKEGSATNQRFKKVLYCFAKLSIFWPKSEIDVDNVDLLLENNDPISIINFYVFRDFILQNIKNGNIRNDYIGYNFLIKTIWSN